MENRSVTINYEDYGSREELDAADRALLDAAIEAVAGSYAPYSHFNVGAAVRLADGTVVKGANQEMRHILPDCVQSAQRCFRPEHFTPEWPWRHLRLYAHVKERLPPIRDRLAEHAGR